MHVPRHYWFSLWNQFYFLNTSICPLLSCPYACTGTRCPSLSYRALKNVYDSTILSILFIIGSSTKSLSKKKNTGISTYHQHYSQARHTSSPASNFCSSKQKH